MHDMQAHLQKLLTEAEECALISRRRATDEAKRELFAGLSADLLELATKVELAIEERQNRANR